MHEHMTMSEESDDGGPFLFLSRALHHSAIPIVGIYLFTVIGRARD
jgi:hypothetical protein